MKSQAQKFSIYKYLCLYHIAVIQENATYFMHALLSQGIILIYLNFLYFCNAF